MEIYICLILLVFCAQSIKLDAQSVGTEDFSIKSLLSNNSQKDGSISGALFKKLLTRPDGYPHLLHSDAKNLMDKLEREFPDIIKVVSIG